MLCWLLPYINKNQLLLLLLLGRSVISDSLQPHELQHARLLCLSLSSWVFSNSCPLSQWYHPTISSSVAPFSCPQIFPASEFFLMSQLFTPGGQSIGVSVSASVLPVNFQGWFPLRLSNFISLMSRGLSRVFASTTVRSPQYISHPYTPILDYWNVRPAGMYDTSYWNLWLLECTYSHRYTYVCSLLSLPPTSHPIPPL